MPASVRSSRIWAARRVRTRAARRPEAVRGRFRLSGRHRCMPASIRDGPCPPLIGAMASMCRPPAGEIGGAAASLRPDEALVGRRPVKSSRSGAIGLLRGTSSAAGQRRGRWRPKGGAPSRNRRPRADTWPHDAGPAAMLGELLTRDGALAAETVAYEATNRGGGVRTSGRFGGGNLYWQVPWPRSPARIRSRRSARPSATGSPRASRPRPRPRPMVGRPSHAASTR